MPTTYAAPGARAAARAPQIGGANLDRTTAWPWCAREDVVGRGGTACTAARRGDHRARRSRVLLACALLSLVVTTACREEDGPTVDGLSIEGNAVVSDAEIRDAIVTTPSGWLPWAPKAHFDADEFRDDLDRIRALYNDRGYPDARVSDVQVTPSDDGSSVKLSVTIDEGTPVIVERLDLFGFDALHERAQAALGRRLPVKEGEPRNRAQVAESREMALRLLQERGYPYASVRMLEGPGSGPHRVTITVAAEPGERAVFGPVTVTGNQSVESKVIKEHLAFAEGEQFRASRLRESQRRLYNLELFQFALVDTPDTAEQPPVVPIRVTVSEAKPRRTRLGLGYGSEEKARAQFEWRHANFMGGARTAGVETKWSSLDRGVRLSFGDPAIGLPATQLRASLAQWWTYEPAYRRRTSGGRLTLSRDFSRESGWRGPIRTVVSGTYIGEYERYALTEAARDNAALRNDLIALGLDPDTAEASGTTSALAVDVERDTTRSALDPRRGYGLGLHVEKAGDLLGGSFDYSEVTATGRVYVPMGRRATWASRVRAGSLFAADSARIPFFKRYFLGGSNSVRGWGRYEISPLTENGLPTGGKSMTEASTELRVRAGRNLGFVVFLDAGTVRPESGDFGVSEWRYAAGPGLRYETPIGPVRVDLGYQLTPIEGLVIDGRPERRRWRVHFSLGQAF